MAHAQQQILDQIKATLVAGGTDAAARVFLDRVDPLQRHELPAILVAESPEGERIEPLTIGAALRRDLSVQISCVVTHGAGAAASCRTLGLQVEKLLQTSAALAGLCRLGIEITASRLQIDGDADRLLASREQAWVFTYAARREAPEFIF